MIAFILNNPLLVAIIIFILYLLWKRKDRIKTPLEYIINIF
jgi:hypothetical protein